MGNSGMIAGAFSSTSGKADTVLTTDGDVLYYNSGRQRLAIGSEGKVLTVSDADLPAWETASGLSSPLTADLVVNDNVKILFGTGSDSGIYYDGSNLYIDPDLVGSGYVAITGNLYVPGIMRSPTTTLTISSGQVTVTRNNHKIDTEGGASTDDLDGMAGGGDGQLVTLSTESGARDVTVKDATGSNQFDLSTAGNFTMDTIFDTLFVVYRSTGTSRVWIEISRSSNV
jgi:hypothetical protein